MNDFIAWGLIYLGIGTLVTAPIFFVSFVVALAVELVRGIRS